MHAASLFALPPSIAADIVDRLSTKDVCALAQVCVFVTVTPRPVRWLVQTHCAVAGPTFKEMSDALQSKQGALTISTSSHQRNPTHHVSGYSKLGIQVLLPTHNDELLSWLKKCMPTTLGWPWRICPLSEACYGFGRAHILAKRPPFPSASPALVAANTWEASAIG